MREFDTRSPGSRVIHTVAGSGIVEIFAAKHLDLVHLISEFNTDSPARPTRLVLLRVQAVDSNYCEWAKVLLGKA
jgi:hypothetical protein